jgi:hypothetical protein
MRGEPAVTEAHDELMATLQDTAPAPRIAAAEALGRHGSEADATASLKVLLSLASMEVHGVYVSMMSLNAIDAMGDRAKPAAAAIAALPTTRPGLPAKLAEYVPRLIESISASK